MPDTTPAQPNGISRKKFLGLAALSAAGAFAALAIQRGIPGLPSRKKASAGSYTPGKDSIFAPRNPPRA